MYEVLILVNIDIVVFWSVTLGNLIDGYQCFGVICFFHIQG